MSIILSLLTMLIKLAAGLFITLVFLRFLLQLAKADFYNPLCQILIQYTNPLLRPLRRIIPGYFGMDLAALVLMYSVNLTMFLLLFGLYGIMPSWPIFLIALLDLIIHMAYVLIFILLITVLMSFFQANPQNPATILLHQASSYVLAPIRKRLKFGGPIDFSPMIAMLVLFAIITISYGLMPGSLIGT